MDGSFPAEFCGRIEYEENISHTLKGVESVTKALNFFKD